MRPEGMGWRVGVSIATFFGSMIAVILWLFFYAGSFSVYQNIALVVVIVLAFIGVMGAVWASWGMKQAEWWKGRTT
jgi:protein-S-isoprenylcysteine O-methyltransferase Ste14